MSYLILTTQKCIFLSLQFSILRFSDISEHNRYPLSTLYSLPLFSDRQAAPTPGTSSQKVLAFWNILSHGAEYSFSFVPRKY